MPSPMLHHPAKQSARKPNLALVVTRSPEPIDFDPWADRYCAALLDADQARMATGAVPTPLAA